MTVEVRFLPDNVTVTAQPGEPLLKVAERAGVMIPTGCMMGSCHACEVDVQDQEDPICACISAVPARKSPYVVNLYVDPTW